MAKYLQNYLKDSTNLSRINPYITINFSSGNSFRASLLRNVANLTNDYRIFFKAISLNFS